MGTSDVHIPMARVVGSGGVGGLVWDLWREAVNVHGLRRATDGVNVLLTPDGLAKFKAHAVGRGFVEKFPGSRGVKDVETKVPIDFLLTGGVPGDGVMRGMTFPDPRECAIESAGKRYVNLETLVGMRLVSAMTAPDWTCDRDDGHRLIRRNESGEHFADGQFSCVSRKSVGSCCSSRSCRRGWSRMRAIVVIMS